MIVLDTNVISEIMKEKAEPRVLAWVDARPLRDLFTTAVAKAEILFGLATMADGRRRRDRLAAAGKLFASNFAGRVLPFDDRASEHFADIVATRQRAGRPMPAFDAQIAAIARVAGMAIATRNVRDFDGCGIDVVDPWETRA